MEIQGVHGNDRRGAAGKSFIREPKIFLDRQSFVSGLKINGPIKVQHLARVHMRSPGRTATVLRNPHTTGCPSKMRILICAVTRGTRRERRHGEKLAEVSYGFADQSVLGCRGEKSG